MVISSFSETMVAGVISESSSHGSAAMITSIERSLGDILKDIDQEETRLTRTQDVLCDAAVDLVDAGALSDVALSYFVILFVFDGLLRLKNLSTRWLKR